MSDLREQLAAAMSGQSEADTSVAEPVVTTGDAGAEGALAEAGTQPAEDTEGTKTAGAQDRDEHGRFKPKTENTPQPAAGAEAAAQPAVEQKSEPAKPAETGPQTEATRVPPSLPAAVKAKFATLDSDVQQAFAKLEESVQTAKAEWGKKGERLNRFDEIVAPHLDTWAMQGMDAFSGIQTLIAAQNVLQRDPLDGIRRIAASYGLTPAHLAQAFGASQANGQQPGAEGHGAPTVSPDLATALRPIVEPLQQQVQTLQQQLQAQAQGAEAVEIAKAKAEIDQFAADPKNLYFHNVREEVALRLQSGRATTLAEAYEQAVWADPEIRPILIRAEADAAAEEARKAALAKAAEDTQRQRSTAARQAGGSVTGSPAPGAQAPAVAHGNLRDQLSAAFQEHSGVI